MDNQPNAVLQNTTNVYGDGSTIYAFFQRHKRPSDDGTTEPVNKKSRIVLSRAWSILDYTGLATLYLTLR
jgi:hypothetical protein